MMQLLQYLISVYGEQLHKSCAFIDYLLTMLQAAMPCFDFFSRSTESVDVISQSRSMKKKRGGGSQLKGWEQDGEHSVVEGNISTSRDTLHTKGAASHMSIYSRSSWVCVCGSEDRTPVL